jgi:hypothetical protein
VCPGRSLGYLRISDASQEGLCLDWNRAPLPVAALTGATTVGVLRGRVLPRWHGWFSAATALAFLAGGADMARTGFFAADGDYGFLLFGCCPCGCW